MDRVLLKQGAEAKIYTCNFYGRPCVVKERFTKKYRHPHLDKSLTMRRIKSEIRAIMRCRLQGIRVPVVYWVDLERSCIYMEHIPESQTVSDYINMIQKHSPETAHSKLQELAEKVGSVLGSMHQYNIIHGDLTTSNILIQNNCADINLVLIDFGLSELEASAEDKGVDLYVLERAILSSHPNIETFFEDVLKAYKTVNKISAHVVLEKLEEVRLRGRKRTMVG